MKEGHDACTRLYVRLKEILTELQTMEERGQLPPSKALDEYAATVAKYLRYLERYRGKTLVLRLIKHQKMMEELLAINEDVDMLFRMLNLASTAAMMDWKQQWQADHRAQEQVMAAMVNNDAVVLRKLQDTRAQVESVMLLKFEVEQRAERQNGEMMNLMRTMMATVVKTSQMTVKRLPPWFLPSDDVAFEPNPFACGSFGSVHHGVWGSGTKVVVKCFLIDAMSLDEWAQQKIESEINIWHQLNHPNVIKMFGASHVSSPPFIVCEDATNGNLCSYLARSDDNQRQMWRLLYQTGLGLEYIHKKHVVHGDLKLNNILVGADGTAKLSDFGLSTVWLSSTLSKTTVDAPKVSGGLRWRAPECLRRRPNFASDVYSFAMCMIEAAIGEPPFAFLDDDAVRDNLRYGEIPEQPEEMSSEEWKFVVAMTNADPAKRLSLSLVLEELKAFAEVEIAAELEGAAHTCSVCKSMTSSESVICARCPAQATVEGDSSLHPAVQLDFSSSVPVLMAIITTGGTEEQQHALPLLVRKCIDSQARLQLYEANGINVLSDLVKADGNYLAQLYALECLNWASFSDGMLSQQELEALQDCIRKVTPQELSSLLDVLQLDNEQQKEDGLVLCTSIATPTNRDAMRDVGVATPLIRMLRNGTTEQKTWATHALGAFACDNKENCALIGRGEGIILLIALVRAGTDEQKQRAAYTLGNIAKNDANRLEIARDGGISPLVALVRAGTDEQKRCAARALGKLALNNDANCLEIARDGGISPLVTLVRAGADEQKRWAAYTLGSIAKNDANCMAIACDGGISPLVALVSAGTDEQKKEAAYALGNIAKNEANRVSIARDGGILPLLALVRAGMDEQKRWAAYALGNIALSNDANCVAIARDGGISPLVALVRAGTNEQKRWAAYALGKLAFNNEANRVTIARDGGLSPLVALVRAGTDEQKEEAAYTLGNIAENEVNCAAIAYDGGISPLVALVRAGTDEQKLLAAYALGNIAFNNEANRVAIARDGGISPLVALVRAGTDEQKRRAAYALGNIAKNEVNRVAIARDGGISPLMALVRVGTVEQKRLAVDALRELNKSSRD